MSNCIFCMIVNKDIPGKVVYEDDTCLAFLDLSQTTYGHTLVVPKKHFDSILECDDETLGHVMKVTKEIAKSYESTLDAKGFNILTNVHEVAGQTVHHFHVHIIPRYDENDTIEINFTDHQDQYDLDEILNKVQ